MKLKTEQTEDVDTIGRDVNGQSIAVDPTKRETFQQGPPLGVQELADALEHETVSRKRLSLGLLWSSVAGIWVTVAFACLALGPSWPASESVIALTLSIAATLFLGTAGVALGLTSSRTHDQLVIQLARCDDIRAIGPLLKVLRLPGRSARRTAVDALLRLLRRVGTPETDSLPERDLALLYNTLKFSHKSGYQSMIGPQRDELVVAMLEAISRIGDQRGVESIKFLNTLWAGVELSKPVKRSADECLARVQWRLDEARVGQVLLRASVEPAVSADSLLRAAHDRVASTPDELLRPGDAE